MAEYWWNLPVIKLIDLPNFWPKLLNFTFETLYQPLKTISDLSKPNDFKPREKHQGKN